jgi:hypothetical protein
MWSVHETNSRGNDDSINVGGTKFRAAREQGAIIEAPDARIKAAAHNKSGIQAYQ